MNERAVSVNARDLELFLRWAGHRDGEPVELRVLRDSGAPIIDVQRASMELSRRALVHERAGNVYLVPNVIRADFERGAVADADVTHRRVLVLDVDPVRPKGVMATEAERAEASRVTDAIEARLSAATGTAGALARGMSGSGYWLMLALDRLASTDELTDLHRRLLVALAELHNCSTVKVDTSVHNASRIIPAWGTLKAKGTATSERPHRRTHITIPATVQPLTLEAVTRLVEAVEREVPVSARPSTPRPSTRAVRPSADSLFALANATPIRIVADALGLNPRDQGERVIVNCPSGCHERELPGGTGVVLLSEPNVMKCSHATCAGERNGVRTAVDLWAEVRGVPAPDAARAVCALAGVVVPMRPGTKKVRPAPAPSGDAALDALLGRLTRNAYGAVAASPANVADIIRLHPKWAGVLGFDARCSKAVFRSRPPFRFWDESAAFPVPVADHHGGALMEWLARDFEEPFTTNKATVIDAFHWIGREASFDPLVEHLRGLKWDGELRLDSVLVDYAGSDDTPFNRAAFRKWMISGIARAMQPGCKADHMIVFEGPERTGKSTALEVLAGKDINTSWHADQLPNLENKDSMIHLQGPWILEVAELATAKKARAEQLKAFITSRVDRFRRPHGVIAEDFPRRCILAATTNENQYLEGSTGNRRFWPVRTRKWNIKKLREDRDQIVAEAVAMFDEGEAWHLDETLEEAAKVAATECTVLDTWTERVEAFLEDKAEVTAVECLDHIGQRPEHQKTADEKRIIGILRHAGWRPTGTQGRRDGRRSRVWARPRTDRDELVQVVEPVVEPVRGVEPVVEPVRVVEPDEADETVAALFDDLADDEARAARTRAATGIGLRSPNAAGIKAAG
jgi:predicted P-loop ATPase